MSLNDQHKKYLCIGVMWLLIFTGMGIWGRLSNGSKLFEVTMERAK